MRVDPVARGPEETRLQRAGNEDSAETQTTDVSGFEHAKLLIWCAEELGL